MIKLFKILCQVIRSVRKYPHLPYPCFKRVTLGFAFSAANSGFVHPSENVIDTLRKH